MAWEPYPRICSALLCAGNGTKRNLGEVSPGERTDSDSAEDGALANQQQRLVAVVEDEARGVVLGHARELVIEDISCHQQPHERLERPVVVDHSVVDTASILRKFSARCNGESETR
jgi:hypothetical protein